MSKLDNLGKYDPDLAMYVEEERPLKLNNLRFLKWLFTEGRLAGDTTRLQDWPADDEPAEVAP